MSELNTTEMDADEIDELFNSFSDQSDEDKHFTEVISELTGSPSKINIVLSKGEAEAVEEQLHNAKAFEEAVRKKEKYKQRSREINLAFQPIFW